MLDIVSITFKQAWSEIGQNRLRSFLTVLCISWGLASLVLVRSTSDGFREGQRQSLARFGEGIVTVWGGRTETQAGGQRSGREIRLTERDLHVIRQQCPAVELAAGQLSSTDVQVSTSAGSGQFELLGVDPAYLEIRKLPVESGRHLQWLDVHASRRVCVLGWNVQNRLFNREEDALGSTVAINGFPYRVVGVRGYSAQSGSPDGIDDSKILLPITSLRRDAPPSAVHSQDSLSAIVYRPRSLDRWREAQLEVRRVLGRINNFEPRDSAALRFWDTQESALTIQRVIASMETFLVGVSMITLLLGGVNVMNMMMISVAERTAEIGIRKAIGATRGRILMEFLLEGAFLALVGGLFGFLGVALLAPWVDSIPMSNLFAGLSIHLKPVLMAGAALGSVAVLSALPPAMRASRLTPVEALREER